MAAGTSLGAEDGAGPAKTPHPDWLPALTDSPARGCPWPPASPALATFLVCALGGSLSVLGLQEKARLTHFVSPASSLGADVQLVLYIFCPSLSHPMDCSV